MSLFKFYWLRRFVREHTNPITEDKAALWKQRLSIGYSLIAWNAFGLVLYMIYMGKSDWAKPYKSEVELNLTPAQQWSRTLGIKDAKVVRVSGTKIASYEIHNADEELGNLDVIVDKSTQ